MILNCVVGKDSRESLDCKEIKPLHPKGYQSWIVIGRTDAEAEAPILWPPDVKNWLVRKDPDAGKDWRQEEKGPTEDETVGWHHWLNGHEFWVSSRSWWWTGKPGVLQSMVSQRVGHDWATLLSGNRECPSANKSCREGKGGMVQGVWERTEMWGGISFLQKWVPRPPVSASPKNFTEIQILGPIPDLLNPKSWRWGLKSAC